MMFQTMKFLIQLACCLAAMLLFTACQQPAKPGVGKTLPASALKSRAVAERNQVIAVEPRGSYYIGRRWFTDGTRYWGFIRQPGVPWAQSRLVVMDESIRNQPDRVPETPTDGSRSHGFDHNYEYRLQGEFTGKVVYDPNSNMELPEFRLRSYELINSNPGFLFYPGEKYEKRGLPPKHPATL